MAKMCRSCNQPAIEGFGVCLKHRHSAKYEPREKAWKGEKGKPRKRSRVSRSPAWWAFSKRFLAENEFCVRCASIHFKKGEKARYTVYKCSTVADHILPVRKYPHLELNLENLQALCKPCHSVKTRHETGGKYYDYKRGKVYDAKV